MLKTAFSFVLIREKQVRAQGSAMQRRSAFGDYNSLHPEFYSVSEFDRSSRLTIEKRSVCSRVPILMRMSEALAATRPVGG